jgi:hypothetical protein
MQLNNLKYRRFKHQVLHMLSGGKQRKLLLFLYANQQLAYWQSPILADWHTDLSLGFNNFSSEKQKSG